MSKNHVLPIAGLCCAIATACGADPTGGASVDVQPAAPQVFPGGLVHFAGTVAGATTTVSWSIQEGASGGNITGGGLYTAPGSTGQYHVVATSVSSPGIFGTATVTVTATPAVQVTVTPRNPTVTAGNSITFSASVTGTSNPSVSWTIQEGVAGGGISSAGVYTAPSTPGTYHVVATSVTDGTKSDTATVTVSSSTVPVISSFTATPSTISAGGSSTLTWSVTGATSLSINQGVGAVTGTSVSLSPTTTTTYTLTATDSAGSVTADTTVTVLGSTRPVVDAGFPKSNWINNIPQGTVTSPTFTTLGATRTLVAITAWYTPSNDPFPATLAWVGGTPAGATAWQLAQESTEGTIHWGTQIWWATATSVLTNVSVSATRANPGSDRNTTILSVYSLSGARTTWGARAEHHSSITEVGNNIYVSTVTVPMTATAANSMILGVSQYGDFYINSTPNALVTIDYQQTDGGSDGGAAAWHKTTTTAASTAYTLGVQLIGDTGNTRAWSGCAVEVLAP